MERLPGKPVADRVLNEIRSLIDPDHPPTLVIYMIGSDPSAAIYARTKVRKGEKVGLRTILRELPTDITSEEVRFKILQDGSSEDIDGIMLESPLPPSLDRDLLIRAIPPMKDVEGITYENFGMLSLGTPRFIPPTPLGAMLLLRHYDIDLNGKEVVIVGRGRDVGRPLSTLLSMKTGWGNATVTLAHSRTSDLGKVTRRADVLLTGVGRKALVTREMIKEGAIVIDMGINPLPDGSGITGDVDMDSIDGWASKATPTPGGTGPVTVSAIFLNLVIASRMRRSREMVFNDDLIEVFYGNRGYQ